MPSSRGFSQRRDWIHVSHTAGEFFTVWATTLPILCPCRVVWLLCYSPILPYDRELAQFYKTCWSHDENTKAAPCREMARDTEGYRAVCSHFVHSVAHEPRWLPRCYSLLTSESVSIATGAGRRRGALGPDDRGKGTLLFDSRKNWRGKREDGGCAGRSNSGTWWHDWKAKDSPSLERERSRS